MAIVTGGGAGIGRATSLQLAATGSRVLVVDIDQSAGAETVRLIAAAGGTASLLVADVTTESEAIRIAAACDKEFGPPNILANIVGGSQRTGPVTTLAKQEWDRLLVLNLTSVFVMCKHVIPLMAHRGGGSIVNVAAQAGTVGVRHNPAYSAAKGGVIALTRALAIDHVSAGIRVNCIVPGTTLTPLMQQNRTPAEIQELAKISLMQRVSAPDEIAATIVFMASQQASYVTGEVLIVNGGSGGRTGV